LETKGPGGPAPDDAKRRGVPVLRAEGQRASTLKLGWALVPTGQKAE
jgi:hypothetical protein